MLTQTTKAVSFAALHAQADAFIIPNPWDVGTARLLATLGFEALATTSAGYAFSAGRPDNVVTRDETIAQAASIASATDLPVSADLENGFGDDPGSVAETIRLAAAAGVVGGSIEDASARTNGKPYDITLATDRIRAAGEAAHDHDAAAADERRVESRHTPAIDPGVLQVVAQPHTNRDRTSGIRCGDDAAERHGGIVVIALARTQPRRPVVLR